MSVSKIVALFGLGFCTPHLGYAQIHEQFKCPAGAYRLACDSYEELVQASDSSVSDINLACFRESEEDFFVIKVGYVSSIPGSWWRLNSRYDYELNPKATFPGWVGISTFKNGIEDSSQNPYIASSGTWFALGGGLTFDGHEWSYRAKAGAGPKPNSELEITTDQITLSKHYISQTEKSVNYSLTIQLSTKRFSESFDVAHDAKLSFAETGRCVEVKALPQLPEPPPLSEEQQARKAKAEYCAYIAPADADRKGYCRSSMTSYDDYEAKHNTDTTYAHNPVEAAKQKKQYCADPNRPAADDGYCKSSIIYSDQYEAAQAKKNQK
jgi:hypothetical protein